MRSRLSIRFLIFLIAALFLLVATMMTLTAAQQGRGRGAPNPLLSQPAPRLPDGTVNLGRVPGEKGIWQLPYITNMGARNIVVGAPPAPPRAEGSGRGRGAGGGQPAAIGSQQIGRASCRERV